MPGQTQTGANRSGLPPPLWQGFRSSGQLQYDTGEGQELIRWVSQIQQMGRESHPSCLHSVFCFFPLHWVSGPHGRRTERAEAELGSSSAGLPLPLLW